MKRISTILCLLMLSSLPLFAQNTTSELLKNPDIIWAIECYSNFHPDKDYEEHQALKLKHSQSIFIKFLATPIREGVYIKYADDCIFNNRHFTEKIFSEENFKKNKLYKADDFSKELTAKEKTELLHIPDTIETFDPDTFEKIIQHVTSSFEFNAVSHYKIKQVVYYNKKDTMFRVIPIAIAPVINKFDNMTGYITGTYTPFWMPVEEAAKTDLHNPNLDLIKRTGYLIPLLENSKMIKENLPILSVFDTFFNDLIANADKALVYNAYFLLGSELMHSESIKDLKYYYEYKEVTDSITQQWEIDTIPISKIKDISGLQVVQDWIWDDKKQKLFIAYKGFSVILDYYDNNRNFINSSPMFYRRKK